MLSDGKLTIILRIVRNGIAIMHRFARMSSDPGRPHNTSAWDCAIGLRNTSTALKLYGDKVPRFVRETLEVHMRQEKCHCCFRTRTIAEDLAIKISEFHDRVLREHGLLSYLACMPLGGERAALAEAIFYRYPDDPHATVQGTLAEVYHQSLALVDLILLAESASEEELRRAEADQRLLMAMLGVTEEDYTLFGADEECTRPTMEAHNV